MRLSRNTIQKAVASVAVGGGFLAAGQANAGLVYDLRLANGAHSLPSAAPGTYVLQLWCQISGTDAIHYNDWLLNSTLVVASTQGAGGGYIASGGGGIVNNGGASGANSTRPVTPFNSPTSGTAHRGAQNNITNDGVTDWGGTSGNDSSVDTDTNYMVARADGIIRGGSPANSTTGASGIGNAVGTTGWEFNIAQFAVAVNTIGNPLSSTTFSVMKPNLSSTTAAAYASAGLDDATAFPPGSGTTNFNVTNTNQQGAYSGSTGFTFGVVPEPSSLGLLGVATIGLLSRNRAKRRRS